VDIFAPYLKINGCFVVLNTANENKTIKIFQYPINFGETRDLLQIPGVAEDDIRASLLKGELNHKIRAGEIVVICSDIDLLQFNTAQKTFLQGAGIVNGLDVPGGSGITADEHQKLLQLIHFIDNGPTQGFASNAVRVTSPSGSPFPTHIVWYLDNTLTTKLVEKIIIYNANQVPTTITWNMYDATGFVIAHTVVDTFTYVNNVFEASRTRSISP
jgi:hypothetical protein